MFICQFCNNESSTILHFVQHVKLHRNVPNSQFRCGVPDCPHVFTKFSSLKSHIYRHHKEHRTSAKEFQAQMCDKTFKCHIDFCEVQCGTLTQFLSHLKSHIQSGLEIRCPFGCNRTFKVRSTFASHVSRTHKMCSVNQSIEPAMAMETPVSDVASESERSDVVEHNFPEAVDESLFLRNLTLFYLKLQAKLLLPESTIQGIVEEFQNIHDIGQSYFLSKLKEKLALLELSEERINDVIDQLSREDLLTACNSGVLSTAQRRKTVFKQDFHYVEPVPILLGVSERNGKECFAQYVPVKQTISALFQCQSVRDQYEHMHSQTAENGLFRDLKDGKNFSENSLFQADPSSLGLIIYQDSFEVVNPLGSARKKHKLLAVYLTLSDILPHNRSNIDHMQLVLLCNEQDFKQFGPAHVFSSLIEELKDLEENGVVVNDGKTLKASLCSIVGDNLGSHTIGGFVENFSRSLHFCRYCTIDRNTFHATPLEPALKLNCGVL